MQGHVFVGGTFLVAALFAAPAAEQVPRRDGIPLVSDNIGQWVIERPDEEHQNASISGTTMEVAARAGVVHTQRSGWGNFDLLFDVHIDETADASLILFGVTPPKDTGALTGRAVPLLKAASIQPDQNFPPVAVDAAQFATAQRRATGEWQAYALSRRDSSIVVSLNGGVIAKTQVPEDEDGWIGVRTSGGRVTIRDLRFNSIASAKYRPADFPQGVARPGGAVALPKLRREMKPAYTADAMRRKIQGVAMVEAIVEKDGTVGPLRLVRSVDSRYGLDDEAVKCAKQWLFEPGTIEGEPARVLISIELTFTLR
jgi:TonB family protein